MHKGAHQFFKPPEFCPAEINACKYRLPLQGWINSRRMPEKEGCKTCFKDQVSLGSFN